MPPVPPNMGILEQSRYTRQHNRLYCFLSLHTYEMVQIDGYLVGEGGTNIPEL